ncbi:hypothetical protein PIIN_11652 [Serendipita indica DSM 11827]|uniref:Uncharacterized protein n=1 Tax=Serendipita indica (strain DSM 11827) TaxID=1109443 RepID=G4U281_SERID|nr:hypothetical protein PIIN_11652 [Serendipita indica DSM 11827]
MIYPVNTVVRQEQNKHSSSSHDSRITSTLGIISNDDLHPAVVDRSDADKVAIRTDARVGPREELIIEFISIGLNSATGHVKTLHVPPPSLAQLFQGSVEDFPPPGEK